MKLKSKLISTGLTLAAAVLAMGAAPSAQNRDALKVPGGLAFIEFKGFESWQVINISQTSSLVAVILGDPAMIKAYQAGIPDNGKPFPDGVRMAKIHWDPKKNLAAPGAPTVGGTLHDVDFMIKDAKRFADSGGWGYAMFRYDAATQAYTPGDLASKPPQGNDARCGFACHTVAKQRDYVFTAYGPR